MLNIQHLDNLPLLATEWASDKLDTHYFIHSFMIYPIYNSENYSTKKLN